jgi:PAN domain
MFYEGTWRARGQSAKAHRMMRGLIVGIAVCAALVAGSGQALAQSGYDRPGGDYTHFSIANGDPAVCASRCEHDRNCRAWSFHYPLPSGAAAACWLKRTVRPPSPSPCCVSGVRGAGVIEPRLGKFEYSIDRIGGDYRTFDTKPDPEGALCATACQADTHCRAWTYRRPGYGTPGARCYLKNAIKPPRHRPCCISGVVR